MEQLVYVVDYWGFKCVGFQCSLHMSSPRWGIGQNIQKYLGLKKKIELFGFVIIENSMFILWLSLKNKQLERN